MSSAPTSKKKTEISLIEADIEKGLIEKKVQNLVLKKLLEEVVPDKQKKLKNRETK